jgi:hypothetical protein
MKEANMFRDVARFAVAVGWVVMYLVLTHLFPDMLCTLPICAVGGVLSLILVAGGSGRGRMG